MIVPPEPVGLVPLILIPTAPEVVAAAVEVSMSKLLPFQSKLSVAPDASPSAAVVVVVLAGPSARLKVPPAFTCRVPVAGMLKAPLKSRVPAFTLVPPV